MVLDGRESRRASRCVPDPTGMCSRAVADRPPFSAGADAAARITKPSAVAAMVRCRPTSGMELRRWERLSGVAQAVVVRTRTPRAAVIALAIGFMHDSMSAQRAKVKVT